MSIGRCWEPEDIHIYWVGQKVHSHFSVTSFKNPNEFFDQPERLYSNVSLTRVQLLCAYVCVFSRSVLSDSLKTPWTVAHQAPLSIEFSSKRLESVCVGGAEGGQLAFGQMSATLPLQIPACEIKQTFFPFKKKKKTKL